jgi:DNA repair ATPase RecN
LDEEKKRIKKLDGQIAECEVQLREIQNEMNKACGFSPQAPFDGQRIQQLYQRIEQYR